MKKTNVCLLAVPTLMLTLGSIGCSSKAKEETPKYTKDSYNFTVIYSNSGVVYFDQYRENDQDNCKKFIYKINKSIGECNYIKLEFETNTNVVGWLTYHDSEDATKTNTEKFFLAKGDTEFTSFLDCYRDGAYGNFKTKIVDTISFQGVDSSEKGRFVFKSFSTGDKEYLNGRMYIDDGTIKLGTSNKYGGAVEYLERIDINVIEYLDAGGNVRIDRDIDPSSIEPSRLISSNVNLVNIYDYGREIQPSYYLQVDKEINNYHPKTKYNYPSISGNFQYNPIQCGGVGDSETKLRVGAQVIDYVYKADYIYIKTKAQDWMFVNDQSQGYVEVKYHFGDDGLLIVDNSYLDFYQFTNLNSTDNPMSGQETPATYFVYPLNYYYIQTKSRTIFDCNIGAIGGGTTPIESPSTSIPSAGEYYYAIRSSFLKNKCDWMANVNDQKFGCGIFMPNADYFVGSHGTLSTQYNAPANHTYNKLFYDFTDQLVPSYAVSNYNYLNPQLRRRMVEFIPLEYQYAIYIGDTSEMSEAFENAKDNGLTNENLTMAEGTWPKH